MTTTTAPAAPAVGSTSRYPRRFLISLWSIPVLVIGQFAMLAVIPVVIVLQGVLRDARLRAVRGWTIALGATYATPLIIWLVRPDGAKSLSRDMSPIFVVLVALVTAIVLLRMRAKKA